MEQIRQLYLREAAKGIYEADRHAKKELKKRVRGVRKLERSVRQKPDSGMNEVVEGYCQAVRAALTDDGRPPLDASGLTLQQRLSPIDHSLERVGSKGGLPKPLTQLKRMLSTALTQTAARWKPIAIAFKWVHQVATIQGQRRATQRAKRAFHLRAITTSNRALQGTSWEFSHCN